MMACAKGHAAICQLLVKSGVDTDAKNFMGDSAQDLAVRAGHTAVRHLFESYAIDLIMTPKARRGNAFRGGVPFLGRPPPALPTTPQLRM